MIFESKINISGENNNVDCKTILFNCLINKEKHFGQLYNFRFVSAKRVHQGIIIQSWNFEV